MNGRHSHSEVGACAEVCGQGKQVHWRNQKATVAGVEKAKWMVVQDEAEKGKQRPGCTVQLVLNACFQVLDHLGWNPSPVTCWYEP